MAKILLVEDDPNLSKIYHDTFTNHGHVVFVSPYAEEGLHLAHSFEPDIIFLDIMLPGKMNGFDLLNKIKSHPKLAKIPVVMLTNLDSEKESATKSGAVDYIVKVNIAPSKLLDVLDKYVNKK